MVIACSAVSRVVLLAYFLFDIRTIPIRGSALWAAEGLSPSIAWYTSQDGFTVVIRE